MIKSFLIGFAITFGLYFLIAWVPWFMRDWINQIKYKRAKKKSDENNEWIFKI